MHFIAMSLFTLGVARWSLISPSLKVFSGAI
jgi:hypothetical protein